MNNLELLYDLAEQEGIIIEKISFKQSDVLGVYYKGKDLPPVIGLDNKVMDDYKVHKCILAEELGHYYTSNGNLSKAKDIRHIKQEKIARRWSFKRLVGIVDIINAFNAGARDRYEMAEYLRVTEEFLDAAIQNHREKYGIYYEIDEYIVYFEPNLGVMKKIDQAYNNIDSI